MAKERALLTEGEVVSTDYAPDPLYVPYAGATRLFKGYSLDYQMERAKGLRQVIDSYM